MSVQELVWKEFVSSSLDSRISLPTKIADSWKFCKANNVNPYKERGGHLLTKTNLKNKIRENQKLIEYVQEEISESYDFLRNQRFLFILTDDEGCILWREGHHEAKDYANQIAFIEGGLWTEKEVGTNAIGLTLRKGSANSIYGYEHYAVASHPWSCSSVPIINERNQICGVLDVSFYDSMQDQSYILLILQLIAHNVQGKFKQREWIMDQEMISYAFKQSKKGIICNRFGTVIKISEDLVKSEEEIIGKSIDSLSFPDLILKSPEKIYFENEVIGFFYPLIWRMEKQQDIFITTGISSQNDSYISLLKQARKMAKSNLPVHIFGETGSGKEIMAKAIHQNSLVASGPLISVNCGAISENLLESELFGYAPGAFTGANIKGYRGKIEQAHGGTLFLDEFDSMSTRMQAALLRVLEEKNLTPIGGEKKIQVDFRLITASNRDLRELVQKKQFRSDLFYRIYVCPIHIPPLRERREDIAALIQRFCEEKNWYPSWIKKICTIAGAQSWQGNIRELNNFLERIYVYYQDSEPSLNELNENVKIGLLFNNADDTSIKNNFKNEMSLSVKHQESVNDEKIKLQLLLEKHHYHISHAAIEMGVARSTLYRKIKKYQLQQK